MDNTSKSDLATDITYFDGLGRPKQQISVGATPSGHDLVTPVRYDNSGRKDTKTYLPYATTVSNGSYKSTDLSAQKTYYDSMFGPTEGAHALAQKVYEDSPLDRPREVWNVGGVFRQKDAKTTLAYYGESIPDMYADASGKLILAATGNLSLRVRESVNEDGLKTRTYTDNDGKTRLERTYFSATEIHDTYYVYDLLGRLRWVISPEGSALLTFPNTYVHVSSILTRYAYMYNYDANGNLTEKRIPGGVTETMVYDTQNRMIGRKLNVNGTDFWYVTAYDGLNRPLKEVEVAGTYTAAQIVSQYYSLLASGKVISQTQYDHYAGIPASLAFTVISGIDNAPANGLKTYEKLAVLGGDGFIERAYYYDKKGRLIQTVETNDLGSVSAVVNIYDYSGNIVTVTEHHRPRPTAIFSITTNNSYDHRGRLRTSQMSCSSGTASVNYTYNELGQLRTKTAGPVSQTYTYNIQGLLTKQTGPQFTSELSYFSDANMTGNITRWKWGHSATTDKMYTLHYDKLNRLTDATSGDNLYSEVISGYDRNGNIRHLYRGTGTSSQSIRNYYDGNRLMSTLGNPSSNFTYYPNGNLKTDSRQNLEFTYNYLNLLQRAQSGTTVDVGYYYASDGTKVRMSDPSETNCIEYFGKLSRVRTNGSLNYEVSFGEGFIESGVVYYYVKDHLGSIRSVVNTAGKIVEKNDYYPFGKRHEVAGYPTLSSNRFKFNGKEDQTIGLLGRLDFGARLYHPELGRFDNPDPFSDKYHKWTPNGYCHNNPINAIDPDGRLVIFINGMHTGSGGTSDYWEGMDFEVMKTVNDFSEPMYFDEAIGGAANTFISSISLYAFPISNLSAKSRYNAGYHQGISSYQEIVNRLGPEETIKFITHSMGSAYSKGMIQALINMGLDPQRISFEANFAPFQPRKQKAVNGVKTLQFTNYFDRVANNSLLGSPRGLIKNADYELINLNPNDGHSITDFEKLIEELPAGKFNVINGQIIPQ